MPRHTGLPLSSDITKSGRRHSAASIHTIRNCGKSSVFGLRSEEATGTLSAVGERLKREGKGSPNTKYRSRSALLQERASKLVSGDGELTTRVEPAMIGCEARHLILVAAARQHLRKPQNDTQIIRGGYILVIGGLLHEFPRPLAVRDIHLFMTKIHGRLLCSADIV
jgi:hypothetical protein